MATAALTHVFFYGLFADEAVLRQNGVEPRAPRRAALSGWRLAIGERATLVPESGARAFGIVYALEEREIRTLYALPGLERYARETVTAHFDDGAARDVAVFTLAAGWVGAENAEYAARLRSLFERLGFPADYVQAIGRRSDAP